MQEEQKKTEIKELCVFLLWTYGLTFLFRQVYSPIVGYMLAKLLFSKDRSQLPQKAFTAFVGLSVFEVLFFDFASLFLPEEVTEFAFIGPLALFVFVIALFFEDVEKIRTHGFLGNKWKLSLKILLLFMFLYPFSWFLAVFISQGKFLFGPSFIILFIINFFVLLVADPSSFCEEYGWRLYFQPLLQRKFGRRLGVLIFALMWEIWHLPPMLLIYGPQVLSSGEVESLEQFFFMHLIGAFVLSIFLAYAYMKTENVWLATFIHVSANAFAVTVASVSADSNSAVMTWTWNTLSIWAVVMLAVFVPFFFSKVFKKQKPAETEVVVEEKE